jgi:hypothetical protein
MVTSREPLACTFEYVPAPTPLVLVAVLAAGVEPPPRTLPPFLRRAASSKRLRAPAAARRRWHAGTSAGGFPKSPKRRMKEQFQQFVQGARMGRCCRCSCYSRHSRPAPSLAACRSPSPLRERDCDGRGNGADNQQADAGLHRGPLRLRLHLRDPDVPAGRRVRTRVASLLGDLEARTARGAAALPPRRGRLRVAAGCAVRRNPIERRPLRQPLEITRRAARPGRRPLRRRAQRRRDGRRRQLVRRIACSAAPAPPPLLQRVPSHIQGIFQLPKTAQRSVPLAGPRCSRLPRCLPGARSPASQGVATAQLAAYSRGRVARAGGSCEQGKLLATGSGARNLLQYRGAGSRTRAQVRHLSLRGCRVAPLSCATAGTGDVLAQCACSQHRDLRIPHASPPALLEPSCPGTARC